MLRRLDEDPELVRARSPLAHRATLLHYVGANGVEEQKSPPNAAEVARVLLRAGAEVDALAQVYDSDTPMILTVTSCVPYCAGVQVDIVDALLDHGSRIDGVHNDGTPLGCALLFGYTQAAERLAERGARVDNLAFAAGLGRTQLMLDMLSHGHDSIPRRQDDRAGRFSYPIARAADPLGVALIVAATHGRLATVQALLDGGVEVNTAPFCGQTALHVAAYTGQTAVVDELLRRGADPSRVESQMHRTAAGWAAENGHAALVQKLIKAPSAVPGPPPDTERGG